MTNLKPIPRYNNHGQECKGHANWMLDCTFEDIDSREIMINVLDKHIEGIERELK